MKHTCEGRRMKEAERRESSSKDTLLLSRHGEGGDSPGFAMRVQRHAQHARARLPGHLHTAGERDETMGEGAETFRSREEEDRTRQQTPPKAGEQMQTNT